MVSRPMASLAQAISDSSCLEVPGATLVARIGSAETAGTYTVLDYVAPPHFAGPALHWHARTSEWYYVVAGTFAFAVDDETITTERGESLLIPPRVTHTFWNPTADPASLLIIASPGGIDRYYAELAALIAVETHGVDRDTAAIAALAARYDILSLDTL